MITLRDIQSNDKDTIRGWRNTLEISRFMYTDRAISQEEHEVWFGRILKDPSCKYWIIVCDGEDVGLVDLYNIDRTNSRCYWAFYVIGSNLRGKGVGTVVEYLVLMYVFNELKLSKLCCEVLSFNKAVVNMHQKFGFVQEGVFRKHIMKSDGPHDVVFLAILREEWEIKRPEIEQRLGEKGLLKG